MVARRALIATLVVARQASHELLAIHKFTRFHFGNEVHGVSTAKRRGTLAALQNLNLSGLL